MIWNERIKTMREIKGLTLKDVATALGVSEATAQRYESNAIKNIPYDIIVEYSKLFSCTPCYIMGWESENTLSLSTTEEEIIKAYRRTDYVNREAVLRLLDIRKEEKKANTA